MNAREANVLLAKAALNDPRMKRVDPVERADMAEEWAEVLHDVALADAVAAMREHYASSRDSIMPADIRTRAGAGDVGTLRDITADVIAEDRARQMLRAGVSEAEYEANKTDRAWLRLMFPWQFDGTHQLEVGPGFDEEIDNE